PLPKLPKFPLYLEAHIPTDVECTKLEAKLQLHGNDLDVRTTFTLRTCRDVLHEVFEREPQSMTYWLAPFDSRQRMPTEDANPRAAVDWNMLQFISAHDDLSWSKNEPSSLSDKFIYDRWDGRYRYFTHEIDPNRRPSDPPPP